MTSYQVIEASWSEHEEVLKDIRRQVFIEEQEIPQAIEWDGMDEEATHFLALDEAGAYVGTARFLPSGQIGRMAVLPAHRNHGVGRMLLDAAIDHARASCYYGVFLHAQDYVSSFYDKAGFTVVGSPFVEAGITHVKMTREFVVNFDPPQVDSIPHLHPVRETAPEVTPGPVPEQAIRLEAEVECREQILALSQQARRMISIYSQELDPGLYDDVAYAECLSQFARRNAYTHVRILIHDSTRMVQSGHRLLNLKYRLPSKIHIKLVPEEQLREQRAFLLVDGRGILYLPKFHEPIGFADYDNAPLVQQFTNEFDAFWNRGREDPSLRRLAL
ncbi:MAG: GNAT family N-acetyltransferase [Gammaproteobacteria bacterium]|nr:GNAT family N-acetyltransferase [Gammaproteobacteria bacterium]